MTTKNNDKPLITAKSLTKTFTTAAGTIRVLREANFEISDGSFTVIYGPSGSGKSTLLHMLMGLNQPTTGQVLYDGRDLYQMDEDERAFFRAHTMGIVHQTDYWVNSLSAIENVALPMKFLGIDHDQALSAAEASLKRIGMEASANKSPLVLSGGEQQRVAMARALVNDPSYIVADEPTGNLDSKNGDALIKLLRYLNKDFGRTVVLVTHNIEYLSIADQILIMEDGVASEMKGIAAKNIVSHLLNDTKKRIDGWSKL